LVLLRSRKNSRSPVIAGSFAVMELAHGEA
jgi:hypothetical protein